MPRIPPAKIPAHNSVAEAVQDASEAKRGNSFISFWGGVGGHRSCVLQLLCSPQNLCWMCNAQWLRMWPCVEIKSFHRSLRRLRWSYGGRRQIQHDWSSYRKRTLWRYKGKTNHFWAKKPQGKLVSASISGIFLLSQKEEGENARKRNW